MTHIPGVPCLLEPGQERECLGEEGRKLLRTFEESVINKEKELRDYKIIPKIVECPFFIPGDEEAFGLQAKSKRDLCEEVKDAPDSWLLTTKIRKTPAMPAKRDDFQPSLPPKYKRKDHIVQPQTTREYLNATKNMAKEKKLSDVSAAEFHRRQKDLQKENERVSLFDQQVKQHMEAFDNFLSQNYRQVLDTLGRSQEAAKRFKDQHMRMAYFKGLLKEAVSVRDEEQEHLDELTSFQQFLIAVTPGQSLKDLHRKLKEEELRSVPDSSEMKHSLATTVHRRIEEPSLSVVSQSAERGHSFLESELLTLRMIEDAPNTRRLASLDEQSYLTENEQSLKAYMRDDKRLLSLSRMYESQCHSILSFLTRLREETDCIEDELKTREIRLQERLDELCGLKDKVQQPQEDLQLTQISTLIEEWPRLAGDEDAQKELQQLVHQIAEIVSDVFGPSNEYSPLIPSTLMEKPDTSQKSSSKGPEVTSTSASKVVIGVSTGSRSTGLGQGALLSLLEAKVTDLCSQLDLIDPKLRSSIFQKCERARLAQLREVKRREAEEMRAERKEKRLQKALAPPPQKGF